MRGMMDYLLRLSIRDLVSRKYYFWIQGHYADSLLACIILCHLSHGLVDVGIYLIAMARGDGQVREVSEGDIIVIPAGVFHGWHSVDERVEMVSVRPDPERVLPAGYVNPYAE